MKYFKKIYIIKWITTTMDIIGMVCCAALILIGIILFIKSGGALSYMTDWFSNHVFSELTGGYEAVGGMFLLIFSLAGTVVFYLIAAIAIMLFLMFLVPSVHGIVLISRTTNNLKEGEESYRRAATRDCIIKMIFNGIPFLLFIMDLVGDIGESYAIIFITAYYAVIYGLEVYVLWLLKGAKFR